MCWDISLHTDIEIIKKTFPQLRDERRQLDYNYDYLENVQAITFPKYPILYKDKDSSQLALTEMEWGVLPTYIDDPKLQADRRRNMINVRSERILEDKKSYWYRLRKQRCLIPVSGTFEHRAVKGWKKKVPYFIGEAGRELFYLPGLYQWHETVDEDINEEDMPPIFRFEMPNKKLKHYPVYTLRGYPNRPDGKHRYEQFDWEGLPPLGSDTAQTSLF